MQCPVDKQDDPSAPEQPGDHGSEDKHRHPRATKSLAPYGLGIRNQTMSSAKPETPAYFIQRSLGSRRSSLERQSARAHDWPVKQWSWKDFGIGFLLVQE